MRLRNHWNQSRLPSQSLFCFHTLPSPDMLLWLVGSTNCQNQFAQCSHTWTFFAFVVMFHHTASSFSCLKAQSIGKQSSNLGSFGSKKHKVLDCFGLLSFHAHNWCPFMFCSGTWFQKHPGCLSLFSLLWHMMRHRHCTPQENHQVHSEIPIFLVHLLGLHPHRSQFGRVWCVWCSLSEESE